jgi:acyl-CoA thioesterase-1
MGTRFWRFSALIMQHPLSRLIRSPALRGLLLLCLLGATSARATTLLVLGDSISAAYGMSLEEGWVALLERRLAGRTPPVTVINASISAETTGGALRRLPQLLVTHEPDVVLIELGGNDGLRGFPIPRLRDNLASLATTAARSGASVVLVPMEIPPNYGARYTASFRESFPAVATDTGSLLAPFILDGVATNPAMMQPDGIHPTREAQPLLLETLMPVIEEALP